ncbi:glycolate oxidase subunit GlcE [Phaeobacter inhibens]|uniref:FAD-binding protein n=1 Tax=Phaeobacter inhibens TaxID=221822 RepID=UPI000C9C13BF|nr:FAD-binding protein [Phaeobacter inhibens]AUR04956.1 glycolate oxidase subunit GlcE [Phaeobacter inhibens]
MTPQSEAELAQIIAGATAPLAVSGGGTRGLSTGGETLSVAGLNGVTLYEPGALTLVVQAGTPVEEVQALLARENQRLAFEPMDHRGLLGTRGTPTIGGVFAANVSGPRRIQCGAARDFLLGVRFVDGRGEVLSNGGRVMKNVTGYDLVKLMAGSYGTLGVLSQVSLKVLPCSEACAMVTVHVADLTSAVAAMSTALGSPYDVTGAAYDPEAGAVYIRVEGFEASVTYRAEALKMALGKFGEVSLALGAGDALWEGIRDVAAFHDRPGDVWRISVKPSDAVALAPALEAEGLLFDWGGGLIWALVPAGRDLRFRLTVPGHATLVRASAQTRAELGQFQPQPGPLAAISGGLRRQFDPRGILNPGLMG